ncbi:uncharacterized protein LOC131007148 [Salvia miltiorrhiza]|uniref:uncharacterized protein LOC131007148 n=1 Tax=Salvia miltiorrhiza TaxID=226208 RepID=UPI0025ACC3D2|nr:uncharacterized protein LOC131007148 [Salvia miltiorrhiza]
MPPRRAPEDEQRAPPVNNNGVDFAQFLLALQGFMQQQQEGGMNAGQPRVRNFEIIEQFRRMGPPRFKGTEGPEDTEEWIRELERIFELMGCSEEQKVSCAIYQLAEEASHWWESHARTLTLEQRQALVWKDFKELIMDRYFPQSYITQKETEFLNLKQGNMTLVDYERKFNKLSRYASYLVDTDVKKARREVIDRAQAVSNGLQLEIKDQQHRDSFGKRKWEDFGKGKNAPTNKKWQPTRGSSTGSASSKSSNEKSQCPKCNKFHIGECWRGKNVCYSCGDPGHMSYNCPKNKKETQKNIQEPMKKVKPRVFAMTEGDPDPEDGADTMSDSGPRSALTGDLDHRVLNLAVNASTATIDILVLP